MKLRELAYRGNACVTGMAKFYQDATVEQKSEMKRLIANHEFEAAGKLMQLVTDRSNHETYY